MSGLKLLSCNIEGDRHLESRLFPLFVREQPDVLTLQEVFQSDLKKIAEATGLTEYHFAPLARIDKANVHIKKLGQFGIAVFAKKILEKRFDYYIGMPDFLPEFFKDNNPNSMNRLLLAAKVEVAGQSYQIGTTHFTWSGQGEVTDEQRASFKNLERVLNKYPEIILTGDFNTPRGGEIFDALASRYRDNIPSELNTTIDSHLHKSGQDIQLVVDGLFTSPEYSVKQVQVLPNTSDHMAVVAEIERLA